MLSPHPIIQRATKRLALVVLALSMSHPAAAQQRSEFRGWLPVPLWAATPSSGGDLVQSPFAMPAGSHAKINEVRVRSGPQMTRVYCTGRDADIGTQADAVRLGQSLVFSAGDIIIADQQGCIRYPGPTPNDQERP